jgi:hypothetical protein
MERELLPRHVDSFCRKCVVYQLHFLATFGKTWCRTEKIWRPLPTLFLATNLQQVLGRGIHHLRWRWITGQFLDFFVAELTQFDVSGDSWGIWITCLSKGYTIHFLKKTLFIFGPRCLKHFF